MDFCWLSYNTAALFVKVDNILTMGNSISYISLDRAGENKKKHVTYLEE